MNAVSALSARPGVARPANGATTGDSTLTAPLAGPLNGCAMMTVLERALFSLVNRNTWRRYARAGGEGANNPHSRD
jgi:hypothetical protein